MFFVSCHQPVVRSPDEMAIPEIRRSGIIASAPMLSPLARRLRHSPSSEIYCLWSALSGSSRIASVRTMRGRRSANERWNISKRSAGPLELLENDGEETLSYPSRSNTEPNTSIGKASSASRSWKPSFSKGFSAGLEEDVMISDRGRLRATVPAENNDNSGGHRAAIIIEAGFFEEVIIATGVFGDDG